MTLAIGWLHEGGETLGTWLHEGGDWHRRALTLEDNRSSGESLLPAAFASRRCLIPCMVAVSPPRGASMLPSVKSKTSASTLV